MCLSQTERDLCYLFPFCSVLSSTFFLMHKYSGYNQSTYSAKYIERRDAQKTPLQNSNTKNPKRSIFYTEKQGLYMYNCRSQHSHQRGYSILSFFSTKSEQESINEEEVFGVELKVSRILQ